jgi:hypothetical protein
MSLERSDQYRVLRYLGWSIRIIDPNSASYSGILTRMLNAFPDDAQDILLGMLDRLEDLDQKIQALANRSNIKAIDDIQFFQDSTGPLRTERKNLIQEVASLMDMPIAAGSTSMGTVTLC